MNITERLELIDRLVSEQKPPGEIRGHILAIREQIETYEKKAEHLAELEAENAKLKGAASGTWGSERRIKGRMER
jgi:hypothetical protein